jgi:hypothetical protein
MTRFGFRHPAPAGQIFDPDAMTKNIGKTLTFQVAQWKGPATLVSAEVADDFRSVWIVVETDGVPAEAFAEAIARPDLFPPRPAPQEPALEGEVVEPETVIICEPGKAQSARRIMDARGEYGGVVRESATCPPGQILVIDGQRLREGMEEALSVDRLLAGFHAEPWMRRSDWFMYAPVYRAPSHYLTVR